jgi:hypothetical protein
VVLIPVILKYYGDERKVCLYGKVKDTLLEWSHTMIRP